MNICLLHLAFLGLRNLSWRFPGFKRTTYLTDNLLLSSQLINKEEELLEKEKSSFPLLQVLMVNKIPYEQLWVTAYEFSTKSEEWMNGMLSSNAAGTAGMEVGMRVYLASSETRSAIWIPALRMKTTIVYIFRCNKKRREGTKHTSK